MAGNVHPLRAGLTCKCPECGKGTIFRGFLEIRDSCEACKADFSSADAGDGPAFFVMFLVAILVTPPVILLQAWLEPPYWVQLLVWSPIVLALTMALLRPFKATLFALQWHNKAEEARWED